MEHQPISYLNDRAQCCHEKLGVTFTKLDGQKIQLSPVGTVEMKCARVRIKAGQKNLAHPN
jgi:hypothetical protein